MTTVKLLSAALIAAAALATPAMASESHVHPRHQARVITTPDVSYDANYADSHSCLPAPAVGAFASQPWTNTPPCEPGPVY
jgi:hypothetical protein